MGEIRRGRSQECRGEEDGRVKCSGNITGGALPVRRPGRCLSMSLSSPEMANRAFLPDKNVPILQQKVLIMRRVLCSVFLLGTLLIQAGNRYLQVPEANKLKDKDLSFAVTFDKYRTKADFAKGDPVSVTMRDTSLLLRGAIGFDRRRGFQPLPGEDLKFNVEKNIDPHHGTLSMWLNGQDYTPEVDEGRGNIAYSNLKFQEGPRSIEYRLYEYRSTVYFDWYSSEPPHSHGDVGRVSVSLKGIKKNQWFQITASWSKSELCIYLDGKLAMKKDLPAKVRKTADLKAKNSRESYIGTKSRFHHDNHKYATVIDDFKIYSITLSPAEVSNNYNNLLVDKSKAKIVAYGLVLNGVDCGRGKDADKLEAEFDFRALPGILSEKLRIGKLGIDYTLKQPDGKEIDGEWTFSKTNERRFLYNIKLPGKYVLTTSSGREEVTAKIVRPDLSFIGNTIGDEDTIPSIWIKFAVDGREIALWNRIYSFGSGPFPKSIMVKGKELLAIPPNIVINSKSLTDWQAGKTTRSKRSVTYTGTGELPGGTIDYVTTVEFDGLMKIHFTFKGMPQINSMKLKWRLKHEFCQFLMTPEVYMEKAESAEFLYFNNMKDSAKELWVVSEERGGFAYAPEHDANWVYDPAKPVYKVNMRTGECEVYMVTESVKMPEDTEYGAVFIATPTRPLPQKSRVIRHNDLTRRDSFKLDQIGAHGLLTGPSTYEPHPVRFAAMKGAVPNTAAVYGMANAMTTASPVAVYFKKYWKVPRAAGYTFNYVRTLYDGSQKREQHDTISACNASCLNDLYLYNMKDLLNHEYADGISMIYYDLCDNNACSNELHGCGFRDKFGRKISRFSLLRKRKLVERTVRLCHAKGKLVMLHGQRDYHPMLHGLADYWFPGEQYEAMLARNLYPFTDEIPEVIFKSELNRDVIGTGLILITAITSLNRAKLPEEVKRKATEAMLAMTLLYDIDISAVYAPVPLCAKVWDVLEKYRVQSTKTEFHRFDKQNAVKSSHSGVRVSYYECPEDKYVVVLSNRDIRPVNTEINLSKISNRVTVAHEEYIGTDIEIRDAKFKIRVPSRSFRIVVF